MPEIDIIAFHPAQLSFYIAAGKKTMRFDSHQTAALHCRTAA
ncbi:MAG: hypothetical protein RO009_21575 [Pseudorhodoplanes sp.]|nr:hypothetical protein [Pseudorhodoplanes sp.]